LLLRYPSVERAEALGYKDQQFDNGFDVALGDRREIFTHTALLAGTEGPSIIRAAGSVEIAT
jgi:hypothetical protein